MEPVHVAAALIRENGKILVCTRPAGKKHSGKWEFPGGKLEPGETASVCVMRELREELGLPVIPLDVVFDFYHTYSPDFTVHLIFVRCVRLENVEPVAREGQIFQWHPVRSLCNLDFLEADKPVARLLASNQK